MKDIKKNIQKSLICHISCLIIPFIFLLSSFPPAANRISAEKLMECESRESRESLIFILQKPIYTPQGKHTHQKS